jgi:hypothetical protein
LNPLTLRTTDHNITPARSAAPKRIQDPAQEQHMQSDLDPDSGCARQAGAVT